MPMFVVHLFSPETSASLTDGCRYYLFFGLLPETYFVPTVVGTEEKVVGDRLASPAVNARSTFATGTRGVLKMGSSTWPRLA
jgi:hypothetical protein